MSRHVVFTCVMCAWWRHQMETFSALLAICAGNSPVPGEFPAQRPVTRSFDVFFDLRPNKRLSKQWRGWWFETQSRSLWRQRNGYKAHADEWRLWVMWGCVLTLERKLSTYWWNFRHWLDRELSFWQLLVQPKWQPFRCNYKMSKITVTICDNIINKILCVWHLTELRK